MTPKKYPQNLHTPKKYLFFYKPKKILKFKILDPKQMSGAYVCMKISEYPSSLGVMWHIKSTGMTSRTECK